MSYIPDRSQYPAQKADGTLDIDLTSGKYLKLWQGPNHPGITGNMSVELTVCGDEVVEHVLLLLALGHALVVGRFQRFFLGFLVGILALAHGCDPRKKGEWATQFTTMDTSRAQRPTQAGSVSVALPGGSGAWRDGRWE